jgi:uncharacterized protein YciI
MPSLTPLWLTLGAFAVSGLAAAAENAAAAAPAVAPTAPTAPKMKQFLYLLKLVPRLHDDQAWTEADKAVLQRHVANFKAAVERGQLILAGRTLEPGKDTFGLAIFHAPDEAAAREFMNSDPCVAAGLMTATLHPYAVAFRGK